MQVFSYDVCPCCKKGKGRMHILLQKMQETGSAGKNVVPSGEISMHAMIDPTHLPIIGGRVPAYRSYRDECEECGAVFTFMQEVGVAMYTGRPPYYCSDKIL